MEIHIISNREKRGRGVTRTGLWDMTPVRVSTCMGEWWYRGHTHVHVCVSVCVCVFVLSDVER